MLGSLRRLFVQSNTFGSARRRSGKSRPQLAAFETLEERYLLSPFIQVGDINGLQQAIETVSNGGTIQVAGGTYFTQQITNNPFGQFLRADNLNKNFTIQAAPGAEVRIDGGLVGDILRIRNPAGNPGSTIRIVGITFQSGQSTTPGLAGGITIQNANVDFQNVTFLNNRANNTTGGGAVNASQNSNVRFFDTVWRSNSATQIGGALEVQEGAVVTIRGNTFIDNRVNGPGHAGNSLGGPSMPGTRRSIFPRAGSIPTKPRMRAGRSRFRGFSEPRSMCPGRVSRSTIAPL